LKQTFGSVNLFFKGDKLDISNEGGQRY